MLVFIGYGWFVLVLDLLLCVICFVTMVSLWVFRVLACCYFPVVVFLGNACGFLFYVAFGVVVWVVSWCISLLLIWV